MCTVFLANLGKGSILQRISDVFVLFQGLGGKGVFQESCYMALYKGHVRDGGIYKPVLKVRSTKVSQRHVVHVSSRFYISAVKKTGDKRRCLMYGPT
jgi:hypothetical protein